MCVELEKALLRVDANISCFLQTGMPLSSVVIDNQTLRSYQFVARDESSNFSLMRNRVSEAKPSCTTDISVKVEKSHFWNDADISL